MKQRLGPSNGGAGYRMEGPGYLVWYETREEAAAWAAVLEEARNASVRGPDPTAGTRSPERQDREGTPRLSPIPFPHGSGVPSHAVATGGARLASGGRASGHREPTRGT